jgi:hypothetical protein
MSKLPPFLPQHTSTSLDLVAATSNALFDTDKSTYELHTSETSKTDTIHKGSSLKGNNVNIDAGEVLVAGSSIEANTNVDIKTDVGDIKIINVENSYGEQTNTKDIDVRTASASQMVKSFVEQATSDEGKVKVELGKVTYDETTSQSTRTEVVSSSIISKNGNVNLESAGGIEVTGSSLEANKGTLSLEANDGDNQ